MPASLTPAQRAALSSNDHRVLEAIAQACVNWDGFAPHGAADWLAVRRLKRAGFAQCVGDGLCKTCPDTHDVFVFALTDAGRAALEESR